MNNNNVYSLNNFDFLARSFARMRAEGVTLLISGAVTGLWTRSTARLVFRKRYALYCSRRLRRVEVEH
ncbi:glycogen synthase [Salmonella enterica subsp. enterica]|nr:glycogen synthase [Salmonella enterica subsp. enterica]